MSPTYRGKSPPYPEKSPAYPEKSPTYSQMSHTYSDTALNTLKRKNTSLKIFVLQSFSTVMKTDISAQAQFLTPKYLYGTEACTEISICTSSYFFGEQPPT